MTNRFDNLSLDEMVVQHVATRAEAEVIRTAIKERAERECPVKLRKVYKIKPRGENRWDQYGGRRIYARCVVADYDSLLGRWSFKISGPLERLSKSPTRNGHFGGRFTSKHIQVPWSRIDLTTETDPPEETT